MFIFTKNLLYRFSSATKIKDSRWGFHIVSFFPPLLSLMKIHGKLQNLFALGCGNPGESVLEIRRRKYKTSVALEKKRWRTGPTLSQQVGRYLEAALTSLMQLSVLCKSKLSCIIYKNKKGEKAVMHMDRCCIIS